MSVPPALQPVAPDADRSRLAALELELAARETELAAVKAELHALQRRYLQEVGPHYARLAELDTKIFEREIALGIRRPDDDASADDDPADDPGAREMALTSCSTRRPASQASACTSSIKAVSCAGSPPAARSAAGDRVAVAPGGAIAEWAFSGRSGSTSARSWSAAR